MNIEVKREALKRDLKKVLAVRPDGLPLGELWDEVAREVGHAIKVKDYQVPRLSYFLYLWGGDFRVTENRIYLRENPSDLQGEKEGDSIPSTSYAPVSSNAQSGYNINGQNKANFGKDVRGQNQSAPTAMDIFRMTASRSTVGHQHTANNRPEYRAQQHGNYPNPYANTSYQPTSTSYGPNTTQRYEPTGCQVEDLHQKQQGKMDSDGKTEFSPITISDTGSGPLDEVSMQQGDSGYLTHEDMDGIRQFILTKLEKLHCGIHYNKLVKNLCTKGKKSVEITKVEENFDSLLDFLKEHMTDLVDVSKANLVRLRKFIQDKTKAEEVIDLTNESGFESSSFQETPQQNKNPFQNHHGHQSPWQPVQREQEQFEREAQTEMYHKQHDMGPHWQQQQQQQQFGTMRQFQGEETGISSIQMHGNELSGQHNIGHVTRNEHTQINVHEQSGNALDFNPGQSPANNHISNHSGGFGFWGQYAEINVKPIEKKEFEVKETVVMPVNLPRHMPPTPEMLDCIVRECIETLASANEFVMTERVEKLFCQRFQIHNIRQIGVHHMSNFPSIVTLNRLHNKISGYILGFVKTRPICTLYELQNDLQLYIGNNSEFVNLRVGPLQRSPIIYQFFKFPPDQAEIAEITTLDVLEHFRNYMQQEGMCAERPELEPFMEYLVEQYSAESAYYLGVRIISLPLLHGIMKKAHYDAMRNKRHVFEHFKEQLNGEMAEAFRKFRAGLLQTADGEEFEIRTHYMKMSPDNVILEIFEKFNSLLTNVQMRENSRGQLRRDCRVMDDYIGLIRGNAMYKCMFNLSICMSNIEVEETVVEILDPSRKIHTTKAETETVIETKHPPRKDKLTDLVKTYIERCLNAGSLSLNHLDRIEEKLLEEFGFVDFHLMGHGRFLQFLVTDCKQTLEEGGGLVLGSSSGSVHDSLLKPELTDVLEFVKQCKTCGISQPAEIEDALCKHYGVKELRHIGYGNSTRLLSHADKHRLGSYSDFTVFYQSTLTKHTHMTDSLKVGVLGHQTRDLAKICLHNCPLLEDLSDWSQWRQVFEPELGKLKDFVQRYGGVTNKTLDGGRLATLDFLALETKPGVLLKIVSNTSAELVADSLERRDVSSFCGHLVSMVVAYKGVNNIPKALLAGHIKTALLQLHAADPITDTQDASTQTQNAACQFVLQCLLRIPTRMCVDLADDLFLSPLGQVVGSTKFKQLLVQLCTSVGEQNQLTELGCLLGIQEWTDLVVQKCILSESSAQKISPDVEELLTEEQQEQIEDEEEDDEDDRNASKVELLDEILEDDLGSADVKESVKVTEKGQANNDDDKVITEETKVIVNDFKKDDLTMEVSDEVRSCEDIVNEIRKEEFGVGIHLSEDGQRLMKIQQERLGRSLDRLSKDLYSKDTHFVLELIQNADDNSYHDNLLSNINDQCPSVKFVIDEESVRVRNNELGFQERNIRALCDVGRSTKGKHKFGYIGQKGIGFKSVFRVTDMPEIHSNGFHIKFDVNSGPMGYILPHWARPTNTVDNNWMTNIILPLKPDMLQQARTLAARFNDIHPSLLLFLHRLREISIENMVESSVQTMRRRDVGDNIVEIQHTGGLDRWLVIKKVLDATKISSQAKSGADVQSTEIALAFPIKHAAKASHMQGLPPKQLVFAFLPLRSYGFRFIVQGDFDVPSSREDVDRDSSWNQWLRNEIHNVFLDSLEMFKSHQDFNNIEAVISYLQFVPMEDEVLDFFKPVASDILKKLKARPCVPTQPNSEGVIHWKIPSQTVRVRDPLVRSVITADLLHTHLNLHYLHPDVAAMLNPTLTSCLGIETLTSEHLFQLGKALIVEMDGQCDNSDKVRLISHWLACMYRSLDEFHDDATIQSSLLALRMLPLTDGRLVSLQENTVFIPLPTSSDTNKEEMALMSHLQSDVNSLHPTLLKTNDEEVNSQVQKLLIRLGVRQLSPFDVINHHIIPVLKSDMWKEKSDRTLVSYVSYIKWQTDRQNNVCNLDELKDIVKVITNKGVQSPKESPVHFPSQYGSPVNLMHTFPGYDWTLVDPVYLPPNSSKMAVMSWHDFLVKLGVEDSFSIQKRKLCLNKQELATSVWKDESEFWPQCEPEYVIEDYYCEELETLITHNTVSGAGYQDQMRALCGLLDKSWDTKLSLFTNTRVSDKHGKVLKELETSFGKLLRDISWLPATHWEFTVAPDGSVTQSKSVEIRRPASLYIHSDKLEKLLAKKVLYLDVKLELNSSFHKFLGLMNSVSIETVKQYLLEWSNRKEANTPAVLCTSLNHMKHVYSYLGREMNRGDLQDLLLNHPIYFVPSKHSGRNDIIAGKMMNRNEIWLADSTGLFDKHRGILEEFHSAICKRRTIDSYYSDTLEVMNLFRQEGRIDPQPTVEEYIELLSLLCTTSSPKEVALFSDVLYIFSTIGQALTHPPTASGEKTTETVLQSLKEKVKEKMQKEKVLPTKKGVWVCLNDKPMIADNRDWEKMFADKENVHFLDLLVKQGHSKSHEKGKSSSIKSKDTEGRIQPSMVDVFIGVCGVPKLSESVQMEAKPSTTDPCPKLQAYFHEIIPTMQRYLLARFKDVFKRLEEKNTKQLLKDSVFYETDKLMVVYKLTRLGTGTVNVHEEKCLITPPTFYIHKDHLKAIPEVNKEIARHFSEGNSGCNTALRSFLSELYNIQSGLTEDTSDMLLQRHEADNIVMADNEAWQVETPVFPDLEPGEIPDLLIPHSQPFAQRDDSGGMRAWPPRSFEDRFQPTERVNRPSPNIWPQPQAKDYMRKVRDLPDNIRIATPGEQVNMPDMTNSVIGGTQNSNLDIRREADSDNKGQGYTGGQVNSNTGHGDITGVDDSSNTSRKRKLSGEGTTVEEHDSKRIHGENPSGRDNHAMLDSSQNVSLSHTHEVKVNSVKSEVGENRGESIVNSPRSTTGLSQQTDRRISSIKGDPVWMQSASEYTFDQLASGLELPHSVTLIEGAGDSEIGRWGENLVAEYFQKQKEAGNIVDFLWNNNESEAGAPYDFVVQYNDSSGPHEDYVEVKSTVTENKEMFEISVQQIRFAEEKKENFHIYRVFNAGNPERVRLTRLFDLNLRLIQKQVKLCLFI